MGLFERYLTLWVLLCIVAGVALGNFAPGVATSLELYQNSLQVARKRGVA